MSTTTAAGWESADAAVDAGAEEAFAALGAAGRRAGHRRQGTRRVIKEECTGNRTLAADRAVSPVRFIPLARQPLAGFEAQVNPAADHCASGGPAELAGIVAGARALARLTARFIAGFFAPGGLIAGFFAPGGLIAGLLAGGGLAAAARPGGDLPQREAEQ